MATTNEMLTFQEQTEKTMALQLRSVFEIWQLFQNLSSPVSMLNAEPGSSKLENTKSKTKSRTLCEYDFSDVKPMSSEQQYQSSSLSKEPYSFFFCKRFSYNGEKLKRQKCFQKHQLFKIWLYEI